MATYDEYEAAKEKRQSSQSTQTDQNYINKIKQAYANSTQTGTTYDTSYYDNAYKEFEKRQLESAEQQKAQTEEDYNNRLKQSYISNRQTEKATNEALKQAGIRGGMTETSALKNATAYQNTRNALGTEKASAIREIDKNANDNIFNYKQTNDAAKNAYIEGRQAEDREVARQAEADQKEANVQLWTSQYGAYTDPTELQNMIANITDPTEKAIAQARVNYLNETAAAETKASNLAYWEAHYGGITDLSTLNKALNNATTQEEKTIIQNQINTVKANNEAAKYDQYTAKYSQYFSLSKLYKLRDKATDPIEKQVIRERIGYILAHNNGY